MINISKQISPKQAAIFKFKKYNKVLDKDSFIHACRDSFAIVENEITNPINMKKFWFEEGLRFINKTNKKQLDNFIKHMEKHYSHYCQII